MISSSNYLWKHIPIFACRVAKGVQTTFGRLNSGNTVMINSPFSLRPHGLLTQSPFGLEE